MARVLGESGRYVSQEAARKFGHFTDVAMFVMLITGAFMGYLLCLLLQIRRSPILVTLITEALLLGIALLVGRFGLRKLGELDKQRLDWRKGAVGETLVALKLNDFPNDFWVIHDLATPCGNLDHVVVGPTGVYAIDTKNWKGVVSADGAGELLLNGKPLERATVKPMVGRTMGVRDGVIALCKNDPNCRFEMPFFRAVLAFPSAKVEAKWGSTGSADCVSDERLWDYIVENRRGRILTAPQVESIAQAFFALARMDKGFESQPTEMST
jgi:hypothetical protein